MPADYAVTVSGRLERAKTYPRLARVRREEGTARVSFTVAQDGVVTACTVTGGSGHDLLDAEACALVYRASPLPPPPAAGPNGRLDMSVPIRFSLN
ncbi:energy transducer TonB [Azospirillum melinis]